MVLSISNDYLSDFHVAPKQTARWSRLSFQHREVSKYEFLHLRAGVAGQLCEYFDNTTNFAWFRRAASDLHEWAIRFGKDAICWNKLNDPTGRRIGEHLLVDGKVTTQIHCTFGIGRGTSEPVKHSLALAPSEEKFDAV